MKRLHRVHGYMPQTSSSLPSSHPLRRQALPLTLALLLLLATALLYAPLLHSKPLLSLSSLTTPRCPVLLLYVTEPPPAPVQPACCAYLAPSHARAFSAPTCGIVTATTISELSRALPKHNWLFLANGSTYPCLAALEPRLADYDPRGQIILTSNTPNEPLLLSSGVFSAMMRYTSAKHSYANVTLPALITHIVQTALPHALRVPLRTIDHSTLLQSRTPIATPSNRSENCTLPEHTHALTRIPSSAQRTCALQNLPSCAMHDPITSSNLPRRISLRDLTVLILPSSTNSTLNLPPLHATLRAMLPATPVLLAQPHGTQGALSHLHDPSLSILRYHHPRDTSQLRNLLVHAARTPYVLFLRDTHLPTSQTRLARMLQPLHSDTYDIVGGYVLPMGDVEANVTTTPIWHPDTPVISETTIALRYAFRSEMTLRNEPVPLDQVTRASCTGVHRPTDFLLASRQTLLTHAWRPEFGALAHDEYWIRAMRMGLRVAVCDSAVRSTVATAAGRGAVGTGTVQWTSVVKDAQRLCSSWESELGDIGGLSARAVEHDCEKRRICARMPSANADGEDGWDCHSW